MREDERGWLAHYATVALLCIGGLEWLLGRTISRLAADPALEGTPRAVIEALGKVGFFLVSPSFILAALLVILASFQIGSSAARRSDYLRLAIACYVALVLVVAILHTFSETLNWLNLAFNILALAALIAVGLLFTLDKARPPAARIAVFMVVLAYAGQYAYVLEQLLVGGDGNTGNYGLLLRDLGELVAATTPITFFAAIAVPGGEWRNMRRWISPILVALLFSLGSIRDALANQGFVGVFTTWSLGFNLAWPWPIYAVGLALYLYSVLTCFSTGKGQAIGFANQNIGAGLLMLLLAGYNLQTPYQHLLAILSLLLLTKLFEPILVRSTEKVGHIQAAAKHPESV